MGLGVCDGSERRPALRGAEARASHDRAPQPAHRAGCGGGVYGQAAGPAFGRHGLRSTLASGSPIHLGANVRVRDGIRHHEIDRTTEELFQALLETEVDVEGPVGSVEREFDEKVEIAPLRVELSPRC